MSAVSTVPWCRPNSRTWACDFCHKPLYDCSCPRSVECTHCELNPEDADFIEQREGLAEGTCEHSPDGCHNFVSKDKEP